MGELKQHLSMAKSLSRAYSPLVLGLAVLDFCHSCGVLGTTLSIMEDGTWKYGESMTNPCPQVAGGSLRKVGSSSVGEQQAQDLLTVGVPESSPRRKLCAGSRKLCPAVGHLLGMHKAQGSVPSTKGEIWH